MAQRNVIVGASLTGATAAITLREEGADGDVILIGAEREQSFVVAFSVKGDGGDHRHRSVLERPRVSVWSSLGTWLALAVG